MQEGRHSVSLGEFDDALTKNNCFGGLRFLPVRFQQHSSMLIWQRHVHPSAFAGLRSKVAIADLEMAGRTKSLVQEKNGAP